VDLNSSNPIAAAIAETDPFACFHPVTAAWFRAVFEAPTAPQRLGWPVIARGESTLILAPTGTGKTLTAFLWCLDRLMLESSDQSSVVRDRGAENREQGIGNREQRSENGGQRSEIGGRGDDARRKKGCRIVYVSPLKALAVDVERNLRSPLAGIANMARRMGVPFHEPASACAPAIRRIASGPSSFAIPPRF
jgi:ATP-dependent helicase Lhr and Lhr-like helicase